MRHTDRQPTGQPVHRQAVDRRAGSRTRSRQTSRLTDWRPTDESVHRRAANKPASPQTGSRQTNRSTDERMTDEPVHRKAAGRPVGPQTIRSANVQVSATEKREGKSASRTRKSAGPLQAACHQCNLVKIAYWILRSVFRVSATDPHTHLLLPRMPRRAQPGSGIARSAPAAANCRAARSGQVTTPPGRTGQHHTEKDQ